MHGGKKKYLEFTFTQEQVFMEAAIEIHWSVSVTYSTICEMRCHLEENDMARCTELVCGYGKLLMSFQRALFWDTV